MNEKIVIESQRCKKALILYLVVISIVLSLLLLIPTWKTASQHDQKCYEIYTQHQSENRCTDEMCSYCKHADKYSSSFAYLIDASLDSTAFVITLSSTLFLSLVIYLWSRSYSLVVTHKRVYGTIWWGIKRIDLPLDSVTAIARDAIFKSVCVSTPSGTIRFGFVKNNKDMPNAVGHLLVLRQNHITV